MENFKVNRDLAKTIVKQTYYAEKINPDIFSDVSIPIIFWSTEPLQLKTDVDKLLHSDIFSWVYVHSYSCIKRIHKDFKHLVTKTSVMHNAAPKNIISFISFSSCKYIFRLLSS